MTQTVQTEIPDQLFNQAQTLVHQGWAGQFSGNRQRCLAALSGIPSRGVDRSLYQG